jgi:hypothetical protein
MRLRQWLTEPDRYVAVSRGAWQPASFRPGHEQTSWPNWRRAATDKPADFAPVLPRSMPGGADRLMQRIPATVSVEASSHSTFRAMF